MKNLILILLLTIIISNNSLAQNKFHINLDEFEVEDSIAAKDLYLKKLQDSRKALQLRSSVSYYNFSYTITVPGSNWTEKLNGVIKISPSPFRTPFITFCKINHQADSLFMQSSIYKHSKHYEWFAFVQDLAYFKKEKIPKHVKKMENIKLASSEESTIFSMNSSNGKVEIKAYFKNGLIVKKERTKTYKNAKTTYRNREYTIGNENKIINKFHSKTVEKFNKTLFVSELDISLIEEEYKGEDINRYIFFGTYLNWLKELNKMNKK